MVRSRSAAPRGAAEASSFDNLRIWDGSQDRAFEELSYQLLKGEVPAGSIAVRTGNPDGGVEWYATLPDGSDWGWQAKFVRRFDDLLSAMEASVKRVVRDRPSTTKLTFVIRRNLATSTRAGQRKSQRQKYDDRVEHWKRDIPGASGMAFDLVQESDLLERLTKPEHRGRRWFWWDQLVLGQEWLAQRLAEQVDAAGEKYRPDLQVDLPIQADLDALGFAQSVLAEFDRLKRAVLTAAIRPIRVPSEPQDLAVAFGRIESAAKELTSAAHRAELQARTSDVLLRDLQSALSAFLEAGADAESMETGHERRRRETHGDAEPKTASPEPGYRYSFNLLREAASELEVWLESSRAQAIRGASYFLSGSAGIGKTHLFIGSVARALKELRPAAVLSGAQFGRGDIWASICDQLGLPPLGADVVLGALDAAGEASATVGRRSLILIDALNDTTDAAFWVARLPALRACVAQWPHVALAVSCRDTYLDVVADRAERAHYQMRVHPGFAGRETEAAHLFFDHYGLEAPRIPLLVPEFNVPLFLRMYCESLAGTEPRMTESEHEGRARIFERYLESKLDRVARRLRPNAQTGYELSAARDIVSATLDGLLDEMAAVGREYLPVDRGQDIAAAAAQGSRQDATILLGALESEGILSRERLYVGDRTESGFRILFQAFSDFLILRGRLKDVTDPTADISFRDWLDKASYGVREASAVMLPERFGVELPDLLGIPPGHGPVKSTRGEGRMAPGNMRIYQSFLRSLPYREASSITLRTVEILNAAMGSMAATDLFRILFQIAPQPGNRLNAEALHRYLAQIPMPRRDAFFGIAVYDEIHDESSPIAGLARWASRGPYPAYRPEVLELASIPLVWLLGSSNRYMRDWTTKALVQLLSGHPGIAHRLIDRFWAVDDPYVTERLLVVCYGALLRSRNLPVADLQALGSRIHELAFTPPVIADELMLDAARGIVDWCVIRGHLPASALDATHRPYGLEVPGKPPSKTDLHRRFGYRDGAKASDSYSALWFSVMDMGDFGRYVVASGVRHFSRYLIQKPYPARSPAPQPRMIKKRWAAFEATLSSAQKAVYSQSDSETSAIWLALALRPHSDKRTRLTNRQEALRKAAWTHPRTRRFVDDAYPAEFAQRWVLWRAAQWGWKPRLFGDFDRRLGRGMGREAHKAERWGKKYQWIAYHELLARVADNFHALPSSWEGQPYEGLHQIDGDREIDPTVPPLEYREFASEAEGHDSGWPTSPIGFPDWPPCRVDFARYRGDVSAFVADRSTEPTVQALLQITDSAGVDWCLFDGYSSQGDPGDDESWRGLQQPLAVKSLLVPTGQAKSFTASMDETSRRDRQLVVDSYGHTGCCYAGEIGWSPRHCHHYHRNLDPVQANGSEWTVAQTMERVVWEHGLDCSVRGTVSATMPSSFVQTRGSLMLDERGPSWTNAGKIVVTCFTPTSDRTEACLLVRRDWLASFLQEDGLELVVEQWHQRWQLHDPPVAGEPSEEVTTSAWVGPDLQLHIGRQRRTRRVYRSEGSLEEDLLVDGSPLARRQAESDQMAPLEASRERTQDLPEEVVQ